MSNIVRWLQSFLLVMLFCYYAVQLKPLFAHSATQTQDPIPLVVQTICYHMPEAGEVYLLWGIDGWKAVPEKLRPAETKMEGDLMLTQMVQEGDTFVVKLKVPPGTTIDYGFQIRKTRSGMAIGSVWDGNYKMILSEDDVIELKSNLKLIVTQEFRYCAPEAGEVFLVWGINGWSPVSEALRPAGTFLNGSVMYTPMSVQGNTFVARVQVPNGTTIDYGFMNTKKSIGAAISVWEANGDEDFHIVAKEDGINELQTTLTLSSAKELPRDFEIGPHLLIGVCVTFVFIIIIKRLLLLNKPRMLTNPTLMILGVSASLYFFLLLIRLKILGFAWISPQISLVIVPQILAAGFFDLLYVGAITILFLGFLWLFRNNLKAQRLLYFVYTGVALFSLLFALVNIKAVQMYGRPFSYQYFYYSDFLRSEDVQNAILANVSWNSLLNVVTLSVAMLMASYLLIYGIKLLLQYKSKLQLLITTVVPFFFYFPVANWYINTNDWNYHKLANPITAFLESIVDSYTHPVLFNMEMPHDFEEFQVNTGKSMENVSIQDLVDAEIQNVVLIVLESVPVEYLEAYGGIYSVTPELNIYRQQSLLFNNIYAHSPASNKSLVSILGSIYPWISHHSLTKEKPEINLPTLSSELKKYGYRTAFLSAADIRFQRGDEFLACRQFDKVEDYSKSDCVPKRLDTKYWSYLGGVDEECVIDAFSNWERENPDQPFFAMLWTMGTHYPYFVVDEEIDYGVNQEEFNRFLNALHHSDKAVGKLLRTLEKRGLLESTLVVVVGDHGEAFGRHGEYSHGSNIYEESIHVPLIFINPSLFSGEENSAVGGHIDIAPTIMHILNLPAPIGWQGQSLFSPERSDRAYFFAPWSDFLFGYREENLKFIFNATNSSYEIYDLQFDPYETNNLASQLPDVVSLGHLRLAAWVQYHDKFMKKLLTE